MLFFSVIFSSVIADKQLKFSVTVVLSVDHASKDIFLFLIFVMTTQNLLYNPRCLFVRSKIFQYGIVVILV